MTYTLIIGNKNLSSWSLRPYLALKAAQVPFDEILVRLDRHLFARRQSAGVENPRKRQNPYGVG